MHKYFLTIFALLALALLVLSISFPRIVEYNSAVKDKQTDLQIKANGSSNNIIRFSGGLGFADWHPEHNFEILFSAALFCSLVFTRRIIFSLLFVFLFAFQFILLLRFFLETVEFPMSYFYNSPLFSVLFSVSVLALSYWQATLIHRLYSQKFQQ